MLDVQRLTTELVNLIGVQRLTTEL